MPGLRPTAPRPRGLAGRNSGTNAGVRGAGGAAGSAIFSPSISADGVAAKACRNDSTATAPVATGSTAVLATAATVSLSLLACLLETRVSSVAGILAVTPPAIGTLSRARMLAAAAPTTSRHVIAIIVIALVKQFSVSQGASHNQFPENWVIIKA